jgi:hypothetical protein
VNSIPTGRRGSYLNCLVCAVAFTAACLAIHRVLPLPDIPEVTQKLTFFSRHKDEFDVIFIGSSRVYRHVVPRIFDETTRSRGIETKSFNFGIDAMMPPESYFVLERILALKPRRLKWVFVEAAPLYTSIDADKRGAARAVYWHDWPRTFLLVRELCVNRFVTPSGANSDPVRRGQSFTLSAGVAAEHVQLFLNNYANLGRGSAWIDELSRDPFLTEPENVSGPPDYGYMRTPRMRAMSPEELAAFRNKLDALARTTANPPAQRRGPREAMARAIDQVKRAGASPLFVIGPTLDPPRESLPTEDAALVVFAFNDPVRYAQLYLIERRLDTEHLDPQGAEEFTAQLAERFAEHAAKAR